MACQEPTRQEWTACVLIRAHIPETTKPGASLSTHWHLAVLGENEGRKWAFSSKLMIG